jgi:hypothetical protein
MGAGFYIKVPGDLANRLADDGFRLPGAERGVEVLLADSANLVTVLVGSHEISRFVRHLWAAVRGRRNSRGGTVKVVVENKGRTVSLTLEHEGFGDEGPPEKLAHGMTVLFTSLSDLGG